MPQHPESYVAVTGYWDPNAVPAEDAARLDKQAKLREHARVRAELTRSALVALGLPAARVRASSFDASQLSTPGDQNGHVLVTFFRAPLQLGLPASTPSWPGMLGGPPSLPPLGQPPTVPPPSATPSRDNEMLEVVKKGVKMAVEGVGIERPHGWTKVSVTGVSVGLIGQGALKGLKTSGEIGWGGGLGMKTSYGNLYFSANLDAEKWEITLSYPSDSPAPRFLPGIDLLGCGESPDERCPGRLAVQEVGGHRVHQEGNRAGPPEDQGGGQGRPGSGGREARIQPRNRRRRPGADPGHRRLARRSPDPGGHHLHVLSGPRRTKSAPMGARG